MTVGLNLTLPLLVASATVASSMPWCFFRVDSIKKTQEAQVMPLIWKKMTGFEVLGVMKKCQPKIFLNENLSNRPKLA